MLDLVKFDTKHIMNIDTMFDFNVSARRAFEGKSGVDGYTLIEDDEVIVCGGVHMMWTGVGEGWLVMSKHAYDKPITVARYTQRLFDTIMGDNAMWRVQASVHTNDEQSVKFAEWLGFEIEGVMKKFGPDGTNYFRMARVM
jgi:RimJ/RimL family protein N-acetyltransferase